MRRFVLPVRQTGPFFRLEPAHLFTSRARDTLCLCDVATRQDGAKTLRGKKGEFATGKVLTGHVSRMRVVDRSTFIAGITCCATFVVVGFQCVWHNRAIVAEKSWGTNCTSSTAKNRIGYHSARIATGHVFTSYNLNSQNDNDQK